MIMFRTKNLFSLLKLWVLPLFLVVPTIGYTQTVDCDGTLASWRMTHPEHAKNCRCVGSSSMPVCSQPGSSGSSSPKKSKKINYENEIKKEIMSNIIQNIFAPPQNNSKQEELLRKQQEEELARQKREAEELERQKIFERNKQELLNAMKGTNSTGLKLKGGGEELITDNNPAFGTSRTDEPAIRTIPDASGDRSAARSRRVR